MTQTEKERFISELCNAVRDDVLSRVDAMPEEWDGHELRVYIAEQFQDAAAPSILEREPRSSRRKAYRNAVLITQRL